MVKAIEFGFVIPNDRSISVITPLSIRRGVGGEAERDCGFDLLVLWVWFAGVVGEACWGCGCGLLGLWVRLAGVVGEAE